MTSSYATSPAGPRWSSGRKSRWSRFLFRRNRAETPAVPVGIDALIGRDAVGNVGVLLNAARRNDFPRAVFHGDAAGQGQQGQACGKSDLHLGFHWAVLRFMHHWE